MVCIIGKHESVNRSAHNYILHHAIYSNYKVELELTHPITHHRMSTVSTIVVLSFSLSSSSFFFSFFKCFFTLFFSFFFKRRYRSIWCWNVLVSFRVSLSPWHIEHEFFCDRLYSRHWQNMLCICNSMTQPHFTQSIFRRQGTDSMHWHTNLFQVSRSSRFERCRTSIYV